MDFQLYQSILKFHRRGTFPDDVNFNRQKKHHFKQLCSRYNKPKLTLFNKKTELKVLHSRNASFIIQKLHRDHEHIKAVKLERLVKQSYDVQGARFIVREVVRNCDYCNEQIIHRRFTGPLVHASRSTLDRICYELGLVINERPLLESNCFKNAPSLDPTSFIPKTVDTIDPDYNCVCAALSTILTGNPNQGGKIEVIIRSLRKKGPDRHLLNLMGAAPLINGPDDLNFVTTTDLRMLARTFRTNIYMFYDTDEFEQAHWDGYTGNKMGPNRGGIYLKAGMSGGTMHCFIVTPVKQKK